MRRQKSHLPRLAGLADPIAGNEDNAASSYPELELVKRDIVYFYDLQAEYRSIEPDIAWDMFLLPYWNHLAPAGDVDDLVFPRGCLAIILAGALSHAGNICHAFGDRLAECREAIDFVTYADPDLERLRSLATLALRLASTESEIRDFELVASFPDLRWAHQFTVLRYFESRAERAK